MGTKIENLDLKILKELQRDGRVSFRDIAEKLGVAEGTIYNHVSKLEEKGIIKRFMADIDFTKLGYDLIVAIGVMVEGGSLPQIEENIGKSPNVTAVYDVTGEYDAIVIARFSERSELNDFVKGLLSIAGVKRTNTMMILNVMKDTHGVEL